MKNVHLLGLGWAGLGMAECLKGHYELFGQDDSVWSTQIAQSNGIDTSYSHQHDLRLPTPDKLVLANAGLANTFLPDEYQILCCQDKARTAKTIGDLAPKTYWLRDTDGAGGKGAQMISSFLPGRNYSCEFAVNHGKIIGSFVKERISYSLKYKTEGVENVGSSVVSVCRDNIEVIKIANLALQCVADATKTELHGFYGIDLKEDENGVPKVTEINAGRLLTASYCFFYLTNYNLALAGVKSYFNEDYTLGEYPTNYGILRTMDRPPVLCPPEVTERWI